MDYSAANHYLSQILSNPSYDWDVMEQTYFPIYKELRSELSSLIPSREFYHKGETLHNVWKSLQSRKNKDKLPPPQFPIPLQAEKLLNNPEFYIPKDIQV